MENDNQRKTTISYQLACKYEDWANAEELYDAIQSCQDFYYDKQFPTDNYKNMPRVVLNLCKFGVDLQTSKIVGTPTYISFVADADNVNCLALEHFDEYNRSKLDENEHNIISVRDAKINGFDLVMYRYDDNDYSYKGIYKGSLVLEHIDPKSIFLDNVCLNDIQNQRWIGYWSDEEVEAVKDLCEGDEERKKLIVPDDQENLAEQDKSINSRRVRVYTRFFRVNGEVMFTCSTKYVDLFKYPHALNPRLQDIVNKKLQADLEKMQNDPQESDKDQNIVDYNIDFEDLLIPVGKITKESIETYKKEKEKFYLYPFELLETSPIHRKWYGRSDIKSLRSANQGVNFMLSMTLMCAQNNAYNKIFVKQGALKGQEITNEPGQVIVDYSTMTNGWGIKMAESQPMPSGLDEHIERFVNLIRVVNGFNDVLGGDISNQDLSGVAVQQMIKQSNTAIEQQQKLYWKFLKGKTAIRLMFYKFYVDKARYTYSDSDFNVAENEKARLRLQKMQKNAEMQGKDLAIGNIGELLPYNKTKVGEFNNSEIWGANFDINIEVMQGIADSELVQAQFWENLALNGALQSMSSDVLELYLEANPMVNKRNKDALRNIVEKQRQSELAQVKEQAKELASRLEEAVGIIQDMGAKLQTNQKYTKNLQDEFTRKQDVSNKTIQKQNDLITNLLGEGKPSESPTNLASMMDSKTLV